jgi:DNA-binding beta-propeller fold protein YncE
LCLWVAGHGNPTLSEVSLSDARVLKAFSSVVGSGYAMFYLAQKHWLLVGDFADASVVALDLWSGRVVSRVSVGRQPSSFVYDQLDGVVLVASAGQGEVVPLAFSPKGLVARAPIQVDGGDPDWLVIQEASGFAVVSDGATGDVTQFYPSTGRKRVLSVSRAIDEVALDPSSPDKLLALDAAGGRLYFIDLTTMTVVGSHDFGQPVGHFAFSPDGKALYVAVPKSDMLAKFSYPSLELQWQSLAGEGADFPVVLPGNKVAVADTGATTVAFLSADAGKVLAVTQVLAGPEELAVAPCLGSPPPASR